LIIETVFYNMIDRKIGSIACSISSCCVPLLPWPIAAVAGAPICSTAAFAARALKRLIAVLEPEYVVLGSGNADKFGRPHNGRLENNSNAFEGGFRLWQDRGIKPSLVHGERTP
jgi:hypothetical protein